MEMTKMVPTFLRHFDVELVHPERPLVEKNYFFVIQEGLVVNLKPRDGNTEEKQVNGGAEKESNGY
jgi:hypothetical protein